MSVIEHGGGRWNKEWLKGVTEEEAVRKLPSRNHNQVRKAWKIANGLTVPDYIKAEDEEKPKRKRSTKKKEEAQD